MADPFRRFAKDLRKYKKKLSHSVGPMFIDKVAARILVDAARRVPVRTGALRASGRIEKVSVNVRMVAFGGKGTGVEYATYVEYGRFSRAPYDGRYFLRKAVMKNIKSVRKELKADMEKSLKDFKRKYSGSGI